MSIVMSAYHTEKYPTRQLEPGVFLIYKKAGETLAVLVRRFRSEQTLSFSVPVTYAGRLDPMAEGLVLLLTGERCKEKDSFLGADKSYCLRILFGVATDTYDMLGLITKEAIIIPDEDQVKEAVEQLKERTIFPYPPYASKPVDGVPLFMRARKGELPEVLPEKEGSISAITIHGYKKESLGVLVQEVCTIINCVEGDFRQKEILAQWEQYTYRTDEVCVVDIECTVSSGMYMRSLAVVIGEMLGVPALAYSITRVSIGAYK